MNNSVLIENTADPDILKDGDDYYLVYAIREGALMFRGFQVFHSTDLTNWSKPKVVLDFKDFPWPMPWDGRHPWQKWRINIIWHFAQINRLGWR